MSRCQLDWQISVEIQPLYIALPQNNLSVYSYVVTNIQNRAFILKRLWSSFTYTLSPKGPISAIEGKISFFKKRLHAVGACFWVCDGTSIEYAEQLHSSRIVVSAMLL